MTHYSDSKQLIFFTDFHAHSGVKNCFVYGNHSNYARMIESKLFCRIVSNLGPGFTAEDCDFSIHHMNSKERGDDNGKEACARVVGYLHASLAHSYTLEMTYHGILHEDNKTEVKPFEIVDMEKVGEDFVMALLYQFRI